MIFRLNESMLYSYYDYGKWKTILRMTNPLLQCLFFNQQKQIFFYHETTVLSSFSKYFFSLRIGKYGRFKKKIH